MLRRIKPVSRINRAFLKAFARQIRFCRRARSASASRCPTARSSHEGRSTPARACRGGTGVGSRDFTSVIPGSRCERPGMTERALLRALHRGLLGRLLRRAQIMRGVDQRDMRKRLREIADLTAGAVSYSSASRPRSLVSASSLSKRSCALAVRPPECNCRRARSCRPETPLRPVARSALARIVAQHKPIAHQSALRSP